MIENESANFEIEKFIETLKKCEYITEIEVKFLCEKAKEILIKEENVVYLQSPITV